MKKLLLLPLLLIGITTPVRAEALTWNEFWEPFVESYHHGHDHGSPDWRDWKYDHGHGHGHPHRRWRRCERVVDYEKWVPGHWTRLSNGDERYQRGYMKSWSEIRWYRC